MGAPAHRRTDTCTGTRAHRRMGTYTVARVHTACPHARPRARAPTNLRFLREVTRHFNGQFHERRCGRLGPAADVGLVARRVHLVGVVRLGLALRARCAPVFLHNKPWLITVLGLRRTNRQATVLSREVLRCRGMLASEGASACANVSMRASERASECLCECEHASERASECVYVRVGVECAGQ